MPFKDIDEVQEDSGFTGRNILNLFPDSAAKTLRRLILTCIVSLTLAWSYGFLIGNAGDFVLSFICVLTILIFSYRDFKTGRTERGIKIMCWGLWGFAVFISFIVAGVRTPILFVIPPLIMTIAWMQGTRVMLLMVVLSVVALCSVVLAELNHWIAAPHYRSAGQVMIVELAVIAFSAVIAAILAENIKRLIDKGWRLTNELRRRVRELKVSEEKLKDLNDRLEQRVRERTTQYEQANVELKKLVRSLEQAQSDLVNAEKLASLGSMVAGISHELNTPIGNVLTLTSSMESHYQKMIDIAAEGSFRRSVFDEFLRTGHEMSVIATRSTKRAVELVSSFKQVAVDQTSEQRRNFKLREVVDDNIATLWPSIKKQSRDVQIDNRISSDIVCDSFPGPLGQVVINVMQNAILHGLVDTARGRIILQAEEQGNEVKLDIIDNGIGMPAHVLAHIFDPFFTTKLGQGGSGLGLSISYRIVTSILGGHINATSSPGEGAQFTIRFPNAAPFKF